MEAASGAAGRSGEAFLVAQGLGKYYPSGWAVDDLGFGVRRGEIFGIIGPNGSGKTTTLRILAGLIAPTTGRASANGIDVVEPEHRSRIGYLPEESALYEEMTPVAYLSFFAELYGVPAATARRRITESLARLKLEITPRTRIGDLSKGMRRKVAIARSLINDPDLLIYDEPTSGLDPVVSAGLLDLLTDLKGRGKTIIFSAHNLFHVERICDRIMIIDRGRKIAEGTMDEIRALTGVAGYVVLSTVPVDGASPTEGGFEARIGDLSKLPEIERLASEKGGRILEVRPDRSTLEDIFLAQASR
jgi:ABC-2 type transport system ATP-binding protein